MWLWGSLITTVTRWFDLKGIGDVSLNHCCCATLRSLEEQTLVSNLITIVKSSNWQIQRDPLLWWGRRDGCSPRNWCQLQPRRGDRWSRCSRSRPQEKQYCESESDNSSKKSCRPEHHKKESEDAKPFLSSLGRQERLRCSWHLSQSAKICPIIVILKSWHLKIILIINHPLPYEASRLWPELLWVDRWPANYQRTSNSDICNEMMGNRPGRGFINWDDTFTIILA